MKRKNKNIKVIYKVYDPISKKSKTKKNISKIESDANLIDSIKKLIKNNKLISIIMLLTSLILTLLISPNLKKQDFITNNKTNTVNTITNKNLTTLTTNVVTNNITNIITKETKELPKSVIVTNYIILLNNSTTNKTVKSYTIGGSKFQPNYIDNNNDNFNYNSFIVPYIIDRYLY